MLKAAARGFKVRTHNWQTSDLSQKLSDQRISRELQILANILLEHGVHWVHLRIHSTYSVQTFCVCDIPRPFLKPTRKDKKNDRGKSRQKTPGAIGAAYVEYLVHTFHVLTQLRALS